MELFTKYSKKNSSSTNIFPTVPLFQQYLNNDFTFLRVVQVHQQRLCNVRSNILLESEAGAGDTPCGDHLTTSHISPDIKNNYKCRVVLYVMENAFYRRTLSNAVCHRSLTCSPS